MSLASLRPVEMTERAWGRRDAVLDRALDCLREGRASALVTLLDVRGSAYRRPGAKRLVMPRSEDAGSITPGCLDTTVGRIAERVLETGSPTTVTVDLQGEADEWGLGTGCDGIVDLLVEPLDESLQAPLTSRREGESVGVCTVVDSDSPDATIGDRVHYEETIATVRGDWPAWLRDGLDDAIDGPASSAPGTVTVDGPDGSVTVFVDWLVPAPQLVVFGTGTDIPPLTEAAVMAGFEPVVVGFRGAKTNASRFPAAVAVRSAHPDAVTEVVDIDADTVTVVATHNFVDDRLTVESLLPTPTPYIGIVGARDRFERLLGALTTDLSAADRDRLYGPAGLDLGSDTPGQVALAIVSEALTVSEGRTPYHLRERSGPIHERPSLE